MWAKHKVLTDEERKWEGYGETRRHNGEIRAKYDTSQVHAAPRGTMGRSGLNMTQVRVHAAPRGHNGRFRAKYDTSQVHASLMGHMRSGLK